MSSAADTYANEFQPDQILGGRYRVLSVLGRGGMGIVYKVEQIYLGIELALKTIDLRTLTDISVRRFQAEARAVFALNHPNIISVHDFGLLEEQNPFLAMEFVQGETLSEIFKRRTLTVAECIPVFIQVCNGLAHAHEHGVVHRDIKPGNIMLLDQLPKGTEGSVKILDFGIAKVAEAHDGAMQSLTKTGEIFGSPLYMSPEQCSGGNVDHRSDIYSLGCVIFEALTGTTPFVGESALSTMMMHQSATIPSLKEASLGTDFPKQLEQIVRMMLAKNPNSRYQNLSDAARDLAATARGDELHTPSDVAQKAAAGAKSTKGKTISLRRPTLFAVVAAVFIFNTALGMGAATLVLGTRKTAVAEPSHEDALINLTDENLDFAQQINEKKNIFYAKYFPTDASLSAFENYDGVQQLSLDSCQVTDNGLKALRKSKLLALTLDECNISRVDNIAQLGYLQSLDLRGTYIGNSALPALANLKMLRLLNLRSCKKLTDEGLQALAQSTSLRDVQISEDQFSKKAMSALRLKMPQCTFEGYDHHCVTDEIILAAAPKGKAPALENLYDANQKIIAVAERINPKLSVIGNSLAAMSVYHVLRNEYAEGEKLLLQAKKLFEDNGNLVELAKTLTQLADVETRMNHFELREKYSDQAVQIFLDTMMHNDPALLTLLNQLTASPWNSNILDKSTKNSKIALALVEQFPRELNNFRPIFTERIGAFLVRQHNVQEGLPYLRKNLEMHKATKSQDPNGYARALAELACAETDPKMQKHLSHQALALIEGMNFPSEMNLRESYCDVCAIMADICEREGNQTEAIRYSERAIAAADKIQNDESKRKQFFREILVRHTFRAGRETEARQQAKKFRLVWSKDLE